MPYPSISICNEAQGGEEEGVYMAYMTDSESVLQQSCRLKDDGYVTVSAPGSMMLLGEHAVVRGGVGIAVSLTGRVYVRLTPRRDKQLVIHSDRFAPLRCSLNKLPTNHAHAYTLGVLQHVQAKLSHGFNIDIHSDLSPTHGFGSSAALVVALVAAFQFYIHPELAMDSLSVAAVARRIIIDVQGRGSGCDAYTSALGGVVMIRGSHPDDDATITAERWTIALPLTAIYTGYKTKTAVVLAQVAAREATAPSHYADLFNQINAQTKAAIPCLKANDWPALGRILRAQFNLQQALGVVDTTSQRIMTCLDALQMQTGLPWGAKISGSGLGDCLIVLGDVPSNLFPQVDLPGTELLPLALSSEGVQISKIMDALPIYPSPLEGEGGRRPGEG